MILETIGAVVLLAGIFDKRDPGEARMFFILLGVGLLVCGEVLR